MVNIFILLDPVICIFIINSEYLIVEERVHCRNQKLMILILSQIIFCNVPDQCVIVPLDYRVVPGPPCAEHVGSSTLHHTGPAGPVKKRIFVQRMLIQIKSLGMTM